MLVYDSALVRGLSSRFVPILLAGLAATPGCGSEGGSQVCSAAGSLVTCPRCPDYNELRRPFFGDTHVHTTLSFDANTSDTRLGPADAYKYARGETVGVQPYDENGNSTRDATIDRPLDFVAVSDHSEFLGTVLICEDPSSEGYDHPVCVEFREDPGQSFLTLAAELVFEMGYPELCGIGGAECLEEGAKAWTEIQQAAAEANDHCNFTSFVAYEWTCNPDTNNLHRNVIFRNATVPDAVQSCFEDPDVEVLWSTLRSDCIDADTGCDALTIPHNSNLGGGLFFTQRRDGSPFDEAYVTEREQMEPVIEIFQHKGASECLPDSPLGTDEMCGFEIIPFTNILGINFEVTQTPDQRDFIRPAFGEGLKYEADLGTNPFKHGIVAATDTHSATPGGAMEDPFVGHGAAVSFGVGEGGFTDNPYNSPGGHGVVWAEENSREAIFEGMRRKETYGTSGPRMIVRFFGGWDYSADICDSGDLVKTGYDNGVPMGSDLPPAPASESKPVFVLSAMQDPGTTDQPGTPLQRMQVIKGWVDSEGEFKVKVVDIAGDAENGAGVDLGTCEPTGEGQSALCTRWIDEEFDPSQRAYYYARVIENPVCRWTTQQCVDGGFDCVSPSTRLDEDCCDPVLGLNPICDTIDCENQSGLSQFERRCCLDENLQIEPVIQERAWTSPVWYSP